METVSGSRQEQLQLRSRRSQSAERLVRNEIWPNIPIFSETISRGFTYENPRNGRFPFGPK